MDNKKSTTTKNSVTYNITEWYTQWTRGPGAWGPRTDGDLLEPAICVTPYSTL